MSIQNIENEKIHLIKFKEADNILSFVKELIDNIPCDVNAFYENQIVDAKSLIGLFGMSAHNIKVYAVTNNNDIQDKFNKICSKYKV